MIYFIVGTSAELIKISPVIKFLEEQSAPIKIAWSGMHMSEINELFEDLEIQKPDITLHKRKIGNLSSFLETISWSIIFFYKAIKYFSKEIRISNNSIIVVHGDTLTTLFGAIVGKILRCKVAHIEAGYRSKNYFSPFPEEISRIIVSKLADYNYAPGPKEIQNLRKAPGLVIDTKFNTSLDSLKYSLLKLGKTKSPINSKFAIITLHRFEFLQNEKIIRDTFDIFRSSNTEVEFIFFVGERDKARYQELNLLKKISNEKEIIFISKGTHENFLKYLIHAEFVITDSGGLQEESYFLGIPALIHRKNTEREEGIGTNAVLSNLNVNTLETFISDYEKYRCQSLIANSLSPSRIVSDHLLTEIKLME